MEEYKDLIDLALKIGDKEWFTHLTEQAKQYDDVQTTKDTRSNYINKQNITLEEFNNNGIALQTDEGLRNPVNNEDLEKYKFVKIKSQKNNALKIYKGEEVIVESLLEEESYYYKAFFLGYFQGIYNCCDSISNKDYEIKKQNDIIQKYKELYDMITNMYKEKDKENKELLKTINNKNRIKLWNRIKEVFKKQ